MTNEKILVIGSKGMLGQKIVPLLRTAGYHVETKSGRAELDLSDFAQVKKSVSGFDVVINCAAYTAVDKAEADPITALLGNTTAPKNLSLALKNGHGKLIHFSTDYVYGGTAERSPLDENTSPHPVGVYGHTKFLGDEFVNTILPERSAVFRTSWLHAETGPNFVATILRIAAENSEIKIVNDQFGSPTYAGWLARATVKFLTQFKPGLYHAANEGAISWFDFAKKIVELEKINCLVLPQSTAELNRPAPRPAYSALSSKKLLSLLAKSNPPEPCQTWTEGLHEHLEKLHQANAS